MHAPVLTADGLTLIFHVGHAVPRTEEAMWTALMSALEHEPLDPVFNDQFTEPMVLRPRAGSDLAAWDGARSFSGNFLRLSRAFRLVTRCPRTAALLDSMIRANIADSRYRHALAEWRDDQMRREYSQASRLPLAVPHG